EALHFAMVWLYVAGLSTPDRGLPPGWYAVFLLLRVGGVAWLVVRVWRGVAAVPAPRQPAPTAYAPMDRDVAEGEVREDELDDDELAGDFAGAPDRLLVRIT
ncbi:MAG: hypothetical protein ACTHNS_05295, partial [Marmoricola sp.]